MHREIEHFLSVNTFDSESEFLGTVNEGQNLLKALERENGNESKFLRDIDIYNIWGSNGSIYIAKDKTLTFLNIGKFSSYYHSNCYEATIFDNNGKSTAGSHWITERAMYDDVKISCFDGSVRGILYVYSDLPEEKKKLIIERAKKEARQQAINKFGKW